MPVNGTKVPGNIKFVTDGRSGIAVTYLGVVEFVGHIRFPCFLGFAFVCRDVGGVIAEGTDKVGDSNGVSAERITGDTGGSVAEDTAGDTAGDVAGDVAGDIAGGTVRDKPGAPAGDAAGDAIVARETAGEAGMGD